MPIDLLSYDRLVIQLALRYGADQHCVEDSEQYAQGWLGLTTAAQRFDHGRGLRFMTYAHYYVRGYILAGLRRLRGEPVTVQQFSQLPRSVSGSIADTAATDDEPSVLAGLSDREARILQRRIVGQETMAAIADDEGLSRERVSQIVVQAISRLRGETRPSRRQYPRSAGVSRQHAWQLRQVAAGCCRNCGQPLGQFAQLCDQCQSRRSEIEKTRYRQRAIAV